MRAVALIMLIEDKMKVFQPTSSSMLGMVGMSTHMEGYGDAQHGDTCRVQENADDEKMGRKYRRQIRSMME